MSAAKQTYEKSPQRVLAAVKPNRPKVLIPYDGSDGAETAIDDLRGQKMLTPYVRWKQPPFSETIVEAKDWTPS